MNSDSATLTQINPRRQPVSSFVLIRTLALLAAVCGILIVFTVQLTKKRIEENRAKALKQAVLEVVPGAEEIVTFTAGADDTLQPLTQGKSAKKSKKGRKGEEYYAAYDQQGQLKGIAFEGTGQGYADKIHAIFGYSPELQAIVGMKVLGSKETPGLGDKIDFDPDFKANFEKLDVRLDGSGTKLKNPIEVVKKTDKSQDWQISAITGATISSKAIGRILNDSAEYRLSRIQANLSRLERRD